MLYVPNRITTYHVSMSKLLHQGMGAWLLDLIICTLFSFTVLKQYNVFLFLPLPSIVICNRKYDDSKSGNANGPWQT